jgi:hypothetical protein
MLLLAEEKQGFLEQVGRRRCAEGLRRVRIGKETGVGNVPGAVRLRECWARPPHRIARIVRPRRVRRARRFIAAALHRIRI